MDTPTLNISPEQLKIISEIDEFKGKWQVLASITPDQLVALKKVATIESIGSSTRIEGSKLSDREVDLLMSNLDIQSFKSRDEEEVAGYAECMQMIFESYDSIQFTENHIKQLHQVLLKHATKDVRHRGEYKKLPNHVEAFDQDGKSIGVIFETASPFDTPRKMKELIEWLESEIKKNEIHPLIMTAIFIVHFLAIHPFQDGNGRLSRILTTLLLMKSDYTYVPYSSLEKIIEENKDQYYLALRKTQKTIYTDNSTLNIWLTFFLKSCQKQVLVLENKIKREQIISTVPPLSQKLLNIVKERGEITIRDAEKITGANRNTIKAHIKQLVKNNFLKQMGIGKGAWYKLA